VVALEGGAGGDDATARLAGGEKRRAGWIVNAAGLYALDLLPEPLPALRLAPRKGHLLITPRHPGFCRHQVVEVGYSKSTLSKEGASVAFNLQARPNGQLLLGSSRQYGTTDRAVEPEVLGRMVRRALHFVPTLRRLDILRTWTGFRAATQDHLPILGPVPGHPRLLLNAGHEGLGITNATGAARLVADHLLGRPAAIPTEPYAAERPLEAAA
jgi:glycine/D-amino acid oxidase-like deaminating enzyme